MAHSEFAGEGTGYDLNEIMTMSQDRNGHSNNARVHIPTTWRAMMEQYVQSESWPEYRTVADIVRDALYHRLHWASEQKHRGNFPNVAQAVIRERYRKRLEQDAQYEQEMREFRNQIDVTLTQMLQRDEHESVMSYCEDLLADIDSFHGREQEKLINQIQTFMERAKGRW